MRQAGVTPQTASSIVQTVQQVGCEIEALARSTELEHGRPGPELVPHNPSQAPLFVYVEIKAGDPPVTVDVEAGLGKYATRGHVANIGDGELVLQFQAPAGDNWTNDYHLPAGAVLDTSSWATRKVRIRAVDMDGRAQIMAQ